MLHAVLFTDIVESTKHLAEQGDEEWSRTLERHCGESAALVDQFGGRVVNHTGDGILALFEMPSAALECALSIRSRLADMGPEVLAAVHYGEVNLSGDDADGMTVHITSRLLGESHGQLLTTEAVREMALGSRARFSSIREKELRDVPGKWLVFEVDLKAK